MEIEKLQVIGLILVVLIGLAAYLAYRYLLINPRDSIVDPATYLGKLSNPASIYARPATGKLYSPLQADIMPMDKLLLVDINGDPDYTCIELQVFDDNRGKGARVILYHHQGPVDSYYTSADFVDPAETQRYSILPDINYHLNIAPSGVSATLKFLDRAGKSIELNLQETPGHKLEPGFLAPVGSNKDILFSYFPFFHMKNMNFVLRSGTALSVKIDGVPRSPAQIPVPVNWKMVYLSRYAAAPIIGCWNQAYNGELPALQPGSQLSYLAGQNRYELVENAGHYEIRRLIGFNEQHEINFEFSPPIPDLPALKDDSQINGRFSAGADETPGIIAGEYHLKRQGQTIEMTIQPLESWQPIPGQLWVKTWTWKGSVTLAAGGTVSLKSAWMRGAAGK